MVVTLLIYLIVWILSVSSGENCLLSTKNSNLSWVVSIRKKIHPDINKIICIGLINHHDDVVIPSKCLTQKNYDDFYTGTELRAMTGIEKGSCRQTKDGLNYKSLLLSSSDERGASPNLLRYVATLEVMPFDMEKTYNPSLEIKKRLPDNEDSLRRYVNQLRSRNVICEVPIFEQDDGKANQVNLQQLRPIEKKECEEQLCPKDSNINGQTKISCPDMLWSPDTYSCLSFIELQKPCAEFNMGSPIICENKVFGVLKQCHYNAIVIMQLLTVEHLDALDKIVVPLSGISTCFTDADLLRTRRMMISFTTIFTSFVHRWM